ncbi:MAG: hypothetical protein NUV51_11640 [Sulfuricaulis sp.]|nr:hypothetical protein [Sulfuricaulis sp.]
MSRKLLITPAETPFGDHHPLVKRVDAFLEGKLSTNEIVLLAQDIVEDGSVFNWGQHIFDLVSHCVSQGLCTLTGRYQQ